ncbi:hypothetical protein BC443_13360 [Salinicola sp. MIT1003]|nr:hypothetical protein BC443_13360 [Salinicola sp. MIT1003]
MQCIGIKRGDIEGVYSHGDQPVIPENPHQIDDSHIAQNIDRLMIKPIVYSSFQLHLTGKVIDDIFIMMFKIRFDIHSNGFDNRVGKSCLPCLGLMSLPLILGAPNSRSHQNNQFRQAR